MIFYFSGTGNSFVIAQKLAECLDEKLIEMASFHSKKPSLSFNVNTDVVGFVFPVYAWGMPKTVEDFLNNDFHSVILEIQDNDHSARHSENLYLHKKSDSLESLKSSVLTNNASAARNPYVFLILTCGDDTGKTHIFFMNKLKRKYGLHVDACWSIQMPNTYVSIPGFDVDKKSVAERKIKNAALKIPSISYQIKSHSTGILDVKVGAIPNIKSYVLRPLFKTFLSSPRKFHSEYSVCSGCKLCIKSCPLKNISFETRTNGSEIPHWGDNCTMCLACYHKCPHHAIGWSIFTKKKRQYSINNLEPKT